MEQAFLNVREAADLLGMTTSWVYSRSGQGKFPPDVAFRVGLYWRFDENKLIEWAKSGAAATPSVGSGRPKDSK